jgi:hypothetical protein
MEYERRTARHRELIAKYERQGVSNPHIMAGWEASQKGIPMPWEMDLRPPFPWPCYPEKPPAHVVAHLRAGPEA